MKRTDSITIVSSLSGVMAGMESSVWERRVGLGEKGFLAL